MQISGKSEYSETNYLYFWKQGKLISIPVNFLLLSLYPLLNYVT